MAWPISAADVRAELKWASHDGTGPDPLAIYATAACERIEAEIGPHAGQPVRHHRVTGPRDAVVLDWPAAALTSVRVAAVEQDPGAFDLDGPAGIVYGPFGRGTIAVTAAAPTGVPPFVELAARVLAATWVKQSHVGPPTARSRASEPDGGDVLQGFAMPRRVSEMIRPAVPIGGFA